MRRPESPPGQVASTGAWYTVSIRYMLALNIVVGGGSGGPDEVL